jgi:flagellar hook-associated protein 3 FlgL
MIDFFNPSTQMFLSGMNRIQAKEQRAQQQLTTGLRINSISDDPDHLGSLMQVRASLAQAQQISSNLGRVKTETDTSEGAMQNAVKFLDTISTLATEAAPNTQSADSRAQIAAQVGNILEQLVGVANTSVEGRFVFSGDTDQTQPYSVDLTQVNPVSAYGGATSTRQVQNSDGSLFQVSKTAQDIFSSGNPATDVFQVVTNLYNALKSNDQTGINTAVANLQSSSQYLNNQLAFFGSVQTRVNGGIDSAANLITQLKIEQGGIEDADLTQSITDLNDGAVQQQAALAAEKQMPRTSLFDYLA